MACVCRTAASSVWRVTAWFGLCLQDGSIERLARDSELLERAYGHYFDPKIVNNDIEQTITTLQQAIDEVCTTPQWVPVSWVY